MSYPLTYFTYPFATTSSNRSMIPVASQSSGSISYQDGRGPLYSDDPTTNPSALLVDRLTENQVRYDMTLSLQYWQQHSIAEFIDSATNGGSSFPYQLGDIVRYNSNTSGSGAATYDTYLSLQGTPSSPNTNLPTVAGAWISLQQALSGGVRLRLNANINYYVSNSGNDSTGTGASGTPWATGQHAINYILDNIDLAGYTATINFANGTYPAMSIAQPFTGGGSVQLLGNPTTPTSCVLSSSSATLLTVSNGANVSISGFSLTATGGYQGIVASNGGIVNVNGNMNYASLGGSHLLANYAGNIHVSAGYTINGSATAAHMYSFDGGIITAGTFTVSLTGTPNFSIFATSFVNAIIDVPGITFSGPANGQRYSVASNSVINTNGAGASFFPGSTAGSTATGGQYI